MSDCSTCDNKCCKVWGADGLSVTNEDIQKWKANSSITLKYLIGNKAWFHPKTKEKLKKCPFLSTDGCTIYPKGNEVDIRPAICGAYPFGKKCLNQTMTEPMVIDEDHQINIAFFKGV